MTNKADIISVDERGACRIDQNFPHLIFLSTVLRWSINVEDVTEQRIENNDKAIASMAAWLADKIEDEVIPIYQVVAMLPLGRAEKDPILLRLRSLDGSSDIQGLAEDDGNSYYIGGKELFTEIDKSVPNIDDIQKGGVWENLTEQAPPEWRAARAAIQSPEVNVEVVPGIIPIYVDWKTPARTIADELFDHDTKLNTRDTLYNYSSRVMDEMQKHGIHGSQGRIDNPRTIMREALQGSKWWKSKSK